MSSRSKARWCSGVLALLLAALLVRLMIADHDPGAGAVVAEPIGGASYASAPHAQESHDAIGDAEKRLPATGPGATSGNFRKLTLLVTEGGTALVPVAGFELMLGATCGGLRAVVASATTDRDGRVEFRAPQGSGVVTARGRLASGQIVQCALMLAAEQGELHWALPRTGLIAGRVVKRDTGQPLSGMTVRFVGAGNTAETDALGTFVLQGLVGERVDLEVTGPGFAIEFCQQQGRAWDLGRAQLDVVVEMAPGIRLEGRLGTVSNPAIREIRLLPMGRSGMAPDCVLPARIGANGEFCWPSVPRTMACVLDFVVDDRVQASATFLGSAVDTDLGTLVMPESGRIRVRRHTLGGSVEVHVRTTSRTRVAPPEHASRLRDGKVTQHLDWVDTTLERVLLVPEGECVLDGFVGGRPLAPVQLQVRARHEVVVDLATEPSKEPWVVRLDGGGPRSGMLTAQGAKALTLDSAVIDADGLAHFSSVDPNSVESLRWIDASVSGWQKIVEQTARPTAGANSFRVDPDVVLLEGLVALERTGRISIRIVGKKGNRTVSYRHSYLTANGPWQLRVEAGLEYELVWSLVDGRDDGRTTIGGREQLGLVDADRTVVVR